MKKMIISLLAVFFTVGKVISKAGQTMLLMEEGFNILGVTQNTGARLIKSLVMISTLYVMLFTRFPALLKFFLWNSPQDRMTLWDGETVSQKATVFSLSFMNILVAIAEGFQGYLGSQTFLEKFSFPEWLEEQYGVEASQTAMAVINTFLAVSCVLAYLAFFGGKSVQNSLALVKNLQDPEFKENFTTKNLVPFSRTFLKSGTTTVLTGFAKACFVYFSCSEALKLMWTSVPSYFLKSACFFAGLVNFITFFPSHFGATSNYFASPEKSLPATYCNDLASPKDKVIVLPHWIVGYTNIVTFMIEVLFSLLLLAVPTNVLPWLFVGLICVSAAFTYYVFTIRPMIKGCIENRSSYIEEVPNDNHHSKSCLPTWCCLLKREKFKEEIFDLNINEEDTDQPSDIKVNEKDNFSSQYADYDSIKSMK